MSSRFPLTLNTTNTTIEELPSGIDLDLSGSNISNVGDITASNITATTVTASLTGSANTVTDAAQANITSLGTLTGLTVTGSSNLSDVSLTKFDETVYSGGNVSGTLTPDADLGSIHHYTLTGNITMDTIANVTTGTSMVIILTQDTTGGRELSSTMKYAGNVKTLSTGANAVDVITCFYDGSDYYASLVTGFE